MEIDKKTFDELVKKLAEESRSVGMAGLDEWKDSQKSERLLKLYGEVLEEQALAGLADNENDRTYHKDRALKLRRQYGHVVEQERLLVAKQIKKTFFAVIDAGLAIVAPIGKDILVGALKGALHGAAGI